jgi:L-fuculose-phosphate aldolase
VTSDVSDDPLFERFSQIGRDLYLSDAVSSHGGNMSILQDESILITRRGAMLGRLVPGDIVATTMMSCESDQTCSRELIVHRAVYAATGALAIVHAHPVHTIFRSLVDDVIEPLDSEAKLVLGTVPVLSAKETIGSSEVAGLLADALKESPVAVIRGHGPFAAGDTLEDAFYAVSALEVSCRILDLRDATGLLMRGTGRRRGKA